MPADTLPRALLSPPSGRSCSAVPASQESLSRSRHPERADAPSLPQPPRLPWSSCAPQARHSSPAAPSRVPPGTCADTPAYVLPPSHTCPPDNNGFPVRQPPPRADGSYKKVRKNTAPSAHLQVSLCIPERRPPEIQPSSRIHSDGGSILPLTLPSERGQL